MANASKATLDRFGFQFWLKWILGFAGLLILAVLFWTSVLTALFGKIRGNELAMAWALAVFGSWFILVVPFMRKKERIWKRLNDDQEKALSAWLSGMGIFIGLLVASTLLWTYFLKESVLEAPYHDWNPLWAKAVFGTWIFLILPFLVLMYNKADRIFKEAQIRQSKSGPGFQTAFIEKKSRLLPENIAAKIKMSEPTLGEGHVVHLSLKGGGRIPHVFVRASREILGLYDKKEMDFDPREVTDVECLNIRDLPPYEEKKWLRLDGRA